MMMLALEVSCFMWICGPFNGLWAESRQTMVTGVANTMMKIIINVFWCLFKRKQLNSLSHSLSYAETRSLKRATQNSNKYKQGWMENNFQ
jgi:hypothetical protein